MNSLYDYIVTPLGERYNNEIKVENKSLILNTKIEEFKVINKMAKVVSVPSAYDLPINVGDIVYIHHNVFRRFYNMKGKQQNSRSYFKEDLYFCEPDQIFLYNNGVNNAFLDRCFIQPLKSNELGEKVVPNKGILKYGNEFLKSLGVNQGDLVSFPDLREWRFEVDNELLYCMKSKDILIKHEDEGNEKKYNPSWATSSTGINKSSTGTDCRHGGGCVCGPSEERSCN